MQSDALARLIQRCHASCCFYRIAASCTDNAVLRNVFQYLAVTRQALYAELVGQFAESVGEIALDEEFFCLYQHCLKRLHGDGVEAELLDYLEAAEAQLLGECSRLLEQTGTPSLRPVLVVHLPRIRETCAELRSLKNLMN